MKSSIAPSPKPNVLVVDDTPANLQLLANMLKERGYKTRPVPSGILALQAAQSDPPDVILLDINMPEMNGYEVCERLKADEQLKEIPVIFISALNEILDKVRAFSVGGVDYITKPFQIDEVQAEREDAPQLFHLPKASGNVSKRERRREIPPGRGYGDDRPLRRLQAEIPFAPEKGEDRRKINGEHGVEGNKTLLQQGRRALLP